MMYIGKEGSMNCKQCGEKYPSPQWRYCPSCGAVNKDVMKNVDPKNDPVGDDEGVGVVVGTEAEAQRMKLAIKDLGETLEEEGS